MIHVRRGTALPVLLGILACQGQPEPRVRAVVRGPPRTPPIPSDLAAFRPYIPTDSLIGGACREDPYWTRRGLRGVTWRSQHEGGGFWEIRVAIDPTGSVRHYYEDRYRGAAGRTMIRLDFDAGTGDAENSIAGQTAQVTSGDAGTLFKSPYLDDPSARAARVLERCRTSLDPWGMLAALPESLAPPPAPRPEPRAADIDREWRDSTRGAGHARSIANLEAFEWFRLAILPLYREPGAAAPFAWIARGWIYRVGSPRRWEPWRVAGWVGTVYDGPVSLPVFEIRPDGWFALRYVAPAPGDDGTAWAHTSHLALGATDLELVTWEEHYLRDTPVYIIDPTPQQLREAPDSGSRVVASLEHRTYGVFPLEIRGDWMRVRVQWPGPWCGAKAEGTAEGWIVWRTPSRGPRVASMIC